METEIKRRGSPAVLAAYQRALGREAHVFIDNPSEIFQQLYNRLQWEGTGVAHRLIPERAWRSRSGARPWLLTHTPFPDSAAFVRVLATHTDYVHGCAFSPDGSRIVSASADRTFRVWDVATGKVEARLIHSKLWSVAVHPWLARVVCGAQGGGVHIDLIGIRHGPIVVTAAECEAGLEVRCPACWHEHILEPDRRGSVVTCPTPDCTLEFRVNPFVLRSVRRRTGSWDRLRGRG